MPRASLARPRRTALAGHAAVLALALLTVAQPAAAIDGKLTLHLLRMEPSDRDARRFSNPGWGGGLQIVLPVPGMSRMVAGVAGFDIVNLLDETTSSYDPQSLLRVDQQTSQDYGRVFLGGEFGPHGHGALRPHVGANIALVFYGIHTDVVVPDDYNREQEIRQKLRDENELAFGYDFNAGLDINPWNKVLFDVGVRFLKSFNVPQQLGAGSVAIDPSYVEVYLGVGASLNWLGRTTGKGD
ncbi:MAG: hypothetical protein E6K81_04225 [Candidatus Eisenbacteria bacterium]|uniref:MipA/OmpV family protein n=1 Tax=Eiseniibacteriota bacterium TaxID=2212470 RepID=A0A538UCA4_UNCEI|nr:MAG: hypothetical protein E6K81_04225 [Candidatus Eisenbacteria bacterium]